MRSAVKQRRNEMNREATANRKAAGIVLGLDTGVRADAERLMAQIPADTRTVTARLFGDPLPGRSALDQRGAA